MTLGRLVNSWADPGALGLGAGMIPDRGLVTTSSSPPVMVVDVTSDRLRIEAGLSAHDLGRLRHAVHDLDLPVEVEQGDLVFTDLQLGHRFEAWVERLLRYNRSIHRAAQLRGRPIEPYKPRDLVNLYVAVLRGVNPWNLGTLAHEVVWMQPFANANHRTVTAALLDQLGLDVPLDELRHLTDAVFVASKRLLEGADASLTDAEAKAEHGRVMDDFVAKLQSMS